MVIPIVVEVHAGEERGSWAWILGVIACCPLGAGGLSRPMPYCLCASGYDTMP